jgi:hypothetical protein
MKKAEKKQTVKEIKRFKIEKVEDTESIKKILFFQNQIKVLNELFNERKKAIDSVSLEIIKRNNLSEDSILSFDPKTNEIIISKKE